MRPSLDDDMIPLAWKLSVECLYLFDIDDPTYTNHNVVDDIGLDRDKVGCDNFQPMIIDSKYKCGID